MSIDYDDCLKAMCNGNTGTCPEFAFEFDTCPRNGALIYSAET